MKLSNSEVLLLTQVLYHIRCLDSYFEFGEQIHELHNKLCSQLLSQNFCQETNDISTKNCVWHEESLQEEFDDSEMEEISLQDLLELDSIKTSYKDKKCSLAFEKGMSKSSVDINLDEGDEILCDVSHIERHSDYIDINCVAGWITFDVQKFPKSWTVLLQPGTPYKVV